MSNETIHDINIVIKSTSTDATPDKLANNVIKQLALASKKLNPTQDNSTADAISSTTQTTATEGGVTGTTGATATSATTSGNTTSSATAGTPGTTSAGGGAGGGTSTGANTASEATTSTTSSVSGGTTNTTTSAEGGAAKGITTASTTSSDSGGSGVPSSSTGTKTTEIEQLDRATAIKAIKGIIDHVFELPEGVSRKEILHDLKTLPLDESLKKHKVLFDAFKNIIGGNVGVERLMQGTTEMFEKVKKIHLQSKEIYNWKNLKGTMSKKITNDVLPEIKDKKVQGHWKLIQSKLDSATNDEEFYTLFNEYDDLFSVLDLALEVPELYVVSTQIWKKLDVYAATGKKVYDYKIGTKDIYKKIKNPEDTVGQGVRRISVNQKGKAFTPNTSMRFEAIDLYVNKLKSSDKINWAISILKEGAKNWEIFETHIDKGTVLLKEFTIPGKYFVEAYGGSMKSASNDLYKAGVTSMSEKLVESKKEVEETCVITYKGNRKSYVAFEITTPKIASIKTPFKDPSIQFNTKKHDFEIVANINGTETDIKDIRWQLHYGTTKKGKYESCDLTSFDAKTKIVHQFDKEGFYKIVASASGSKNVETVPFLVAGNFVTTIQANPSVLLFNKPNQNLTLKATGFKFKATDDDKKSVSWKTAYNKETAIKKDYKGVKFTPVELEKAKEGTYTISAYMPNSIYGKDAPAKVTIVHPTVTEAYFTNAGGSEKESTGYNEDAYIYAKLDNYVKQTVYIEVWSGKELIQLFENIKTNEFSEVKDLKFTLTAIDKARITKPLRFTVKGTDGYELKNQDRTFPKNGLQVLDTQEITDAYFIFENKKITKKNIVPYGANLNAIIESSNFIGSKVKVVINRTSEIKFPIKATEEILSVEKEIGKDGTISLDFNLNDKLKQKHSLGKYFYIEVTTPDGYKCNSKEFIIENAMLVFTDDEKTDGYDEIHLIAPWMKNALKEYNLYNNFTENQSPLKEKVSEYFNSGAGKGLKYTNAWCAAFINWCFEETKGYKKTNTGLNTYAFDWAPKGNKLGKAKNKAIDGWILGEESDPFVGAVIVFTYSHAAFIIGQTLDEKRYVYLGGNQGSKTPGLQKIKLGTVLKGKEYAIMKPQKYNPSSREKKLPKIDILADGSYNSTH